MEPNHETSRMRAALLITATLAGFAHLAFYFPRLPDRVATHFDGAGQPDGFGTKLGLAVIYAVTLLGTAALALALPRIFRRRAHGEPTLRIPHRDHWLAPERRELTFARLTAWAHGFGLASVVFLVLVMHCVFRFNTGASDSLGALFFASFAGYLLYVLGTSVALALSFRAPTSPPPAGDRDPTVSATDRRDS